MRYTVHSTVEWAACKKPNFLDNFRLDCAAKWNSLAWTLYLVDVCMHRNEIMGNLVTPWAVIAKLINRYQNILYSGTWKRLEWDIANCHPHLISLKGLSSLVWATATLHPWVGGDMLSHWPSIPTSTNPIWPGLEPTALLEKSMEISPVLASCPVSDAC